MQQPKPPATQARSGGEAPQVNPVLGVENIKTRLQS